MRILQVHARYQQPGGEEAVVLAERELLKAAGHSVIAYERDNDEIASYGLWDRLTLAPRTVWAWDSSQQLRELLVREKPDLAHFHNTFPLISPAAYSACRAVGVPVVQTLHNYRLFCPAATFFRDGHPCEECVEHSLWRSVRYACYRGSRAATAVSAAMLAVHRAWGTWHEQVNCYIALTDFARRKFIEAGLSAVRLIVKPNFVHPDPGMRQKAGQYALFVGRLVAEKGLFNLLAAWERLSSPVPLRIVGDGPLKDDLEARKVARGLSGVTFMGRLSREATLAVLKSARLLIVPSEWYEGFPMTVAEALACGVPVACSRLGALEEIIADGQTGLHFEPGNPDALAKGVHWAWTHPKEMEKMGRQARAAYEARYTAAANYTLLMEIYQRVLADRSEALP